jgi:hypothetical protein
VVEQAREKERESEEETLQIKRKSSRSSSVGSGDLLNHMVCDCQALRSAN